MAFCFKTCESIVEEGMDVRHNETLILEAPECFHFDFVITVRFNPTYINTSMIQKELMICFYSTESSFEHTAFMVFLTKISVP